MKNAMKWMLCFFLFWTVSCTKSANEKPKVWIYTSLYKDTIDDILPKLQAQFPGIDFQFFQAGSEEVATKVNAEEMAGGTQADILISSDRFWYEDMKSQGKLHPYKIKAAEGVDKNLKDTDGFYATVSLPIMTLVYNSEMVKESELPKSFKDMSDPKYKGKFTTGSPLASGTNFTTVAFLQKNYGWDYFSALRKNDTISDGGNSAVIRRLQNKEKPYGWVLLENVLRFQDTDKRLKYIIPTDGVIVQNNVLAIVKKKTGNENAEKVAEWMFGKDGQEAMAKSFMYPTVPGFAAPKGAPELSALMAKAQPWTADFIKETLTNRETIKEKFAQIMLQ